MTVGGGFAGAATTAQLLFSDQGQRFLYSLGLALFTFVAVSGLIFVHDPRRTRLLSAALALQIPWLSSPVVVYQFAAGFGIRVARFSDSFKWGLTLGYKWQLYLLGQFPWGAGVDVLAVLMLVLLWQSAKTPSTAVESSIIKTWLRLTLVTMTVGGGLAGVTLVVQHFSSDGGHWPGYLLSFALYTYAITSGLIFVHDPRRTRALLVALALQIPWLSSPLIAYEFAAGFRCTVAVIGGSFKWGVTWLGANYELGLLEDNPWGVGVNLFAVVMFVLLWWSVKTPKPTLQPAAVPEDPETQPHSFAATDDC